MIFENWAVVRSYLQYFEYTKDIIKKIESIGNSQTLIKQNIGQAVTLPKITSMNGLTEEGVELYNKICNMDAQYTVKSVILITDTKYCDDYDQSKGKFVYFNHNGEHVRSAVLIMYTDSWYYTMDNIKIMVIK